MRRVLLIATLFLMIATLFGCNNPAKNIPDIDTFSGVELDLDNAFGTQILSATIKCDKEKKDIPSDDPRLIRLLNLIFRSEEDKTTPMRQGLVLDEEIHERLSSKAPILDISLQPGPDPYGFLGNASRIVICKDTYMIIHEGHSYYDGLVAEEFFPFRSLIPNSEMDDYPYMDWGQDAWIDLLEISGFVNADDHLID